MKKLGTKALQDIAINVLGWTLLALGVAALVLPGPGLLLLFAGVAVLATRYEWAERRLEPIKKSALKAAADSVSGWPQLTISVLAAIGIFAFGIFWGVHPAAPGWWPVTEKAWLPGGWGTGATLIASGIFAAGMIVFSFIKFRKK